MDDISSYISSHLRFTHQPLNLSEHLPLRHVASVEHDLALRGTYFFIGFHTHSSSIKIDIQPTYTHKYSSSLSLVPHSLIHMLVQVISHTYVTLEPQVIPAFAAYSLWAMNLMSSRNHFAEVLTGAMYICIVAGMAVGAYFWNEHMMQKVGREIWKKILIDVGIVLGSFAMQILGHCMFEEFHSPPNLIHGFVAAPLLEFVSLVFRLGFLAELRVEVDREVEKIRADARHRESVTLLSKNKGSLLASALDEACTSEDPDDVPVHDVEIETTAGGAHVRKRSGTNIPE